ncbi:hypothetical protein M758_6G101600 [Ceratodon purpureus]|uniref:Uncharacterized protein n=1 Tax=Ceratodon purpureus TaxID=3225 RepID=A0A8T0HCW4_CERPU|nr:hypothetical protein KC19_6G105300 [Ceratodon purpureus]KAG0613422.1 hypothetical protein M758_6G101600 [Ceratodon purpureus]
MRPAYKLFPNNFIEVGSYWTAFSPVQLQVRLILNFVQNERECPRNGRGFLFQRCNYCSQNKMIICCTIMKCIYSLQLLIFGRAFKLNK